MRAVLGLTVFQKCGFTVTLGDGTKLVEVFMPKDRTCEPFRVNGFWVIFTDPETGIVLVDILTRYVRKICAG